MLDSTKPTTRRKSGKPHKDFPLFARASGRWAKKVRQKFRDFGKIANDPQGQAVLAEWLRVKDDLLSGRTPRPKLAFGPFLERQAACARAYSTSC